MSVFKITFTVGNKICPPSSTKKNIVLTKKKKNNMKNNNCMSKKRFSEAITLELLVKYGRYYDNDENDYNDSFSRSVTSYYLQVVKTLINVWSKSEWLHAHYLT